MDKNLICGEIVNLRVDAESSLRSSSSRIERILTDGQPLFSEEVGSFPSNAEKFYISTSNKETEQILGVKHYSNNSKWELINMQFINILKNLDSLTNIIFCIQKNYGDNIQYMNISQSYCMASTSENLAARSLCINEASKDELLISIHRRLSILKPFVHLINNEVLRVPSRILTHLSALRVLNELLPIWNISVSSQNYDETPSFHSRGNVLSSVISLQLPSRNAFLGQKESIISKSMGRADNNNLFGDLFATLIFNCKNEFSFRPEMQNLRALVKLPEFMSNLIDNNFQLYIKITENIPESKRVAFDTKPNIIFPPCLNSTLAKQIHSILHKAHWVLIDHLIFHIMVHQIINIQRDQPEIISIRELDSEHVVFSIHETSSNINNNIYAGLGLISSDLSINYRPVKAGNEPLLTRADVAALKLLREAFLDAWRDSTKWRLSDELDPPINCVKSCKYSNKLLEGWALKLAKKCIKYQRNVSRVREYKKSKADSAC
ncbi:hypothetical protein OJ253_2204 [Cryptosporidium canis]|uniref:Uncharacterized protein n=1 Tax=Cryptosporidium canis TaxID=195482 RepID=A0A9D5HV45_9CRYT|nr:hypothetical protein OJ253_2204 [Cryptosporidium canis]